MRNWFDRKRYFTKIVIDENGRITLPNYYFQMNDIIQEGQYFRLIGSVLGQDGVYKYKASGVEGLQAETISANYGAFWVLCIPRELVELASEITEWNAKNGVNSEAYSPYQSESFAGYTYNKGTNKAITWEQVFASRLQKWQKI